ncbi:hypothetical protein A1O1_01289 [Capronia coronata CBS 617.96]|uniref:DUF7605 domain-containing protein n=1 Tax=Capronia coronata CBS 617.96 TaxID=1182541 RepID=W9YUG4_9EURO|nr:uncharacterized protein A1O1_01289 [Capronia coronata CBS 617.96]EXJ96163.1 hypothetical protein A1O1_01289 [Capronia coronata CBS 617.96]
MLSFSRPWRVFRWQATSQVHRHKKSLSSVPIQRYFGTRSQSKSRLTRDQAELREARRQIFNVEEHFKDYATSESYLTALRKAQRRLDALLINSRNEKVRAQLLRKYQHLIGDRELHVFYVDSVMYHLEGSTDKERELSGIPQLRQHLQDLQGETIFKERDHFITTRIPALIGSFMAWMESKKNEGAPEERRQLPDAHELELRHSVTTWADAMHAAFEKNIDHPLEHNTEEINRQCAKVANRWWVWPHPSVAAWVRHQGSHYTSIRGRRCWNTDLLRSFYEVTSRNWQVFHGQTERIFKALETNIISPWEAYEHQCRKLEAPVNFLTTLAARIHILILNVASAINAYRKGMSRIVLSYKQFGKLIWIGPVVSLVLLAVFFSFWANSKTGKGSHARRVKTLHSRVSSEAFVDDFRSRLSGDFDELITETSQAISDRLGREFGALRSDVDLMQKKQRSEFYETYYENHWKSVAQLHGVKAAIEKLVDDMNNLAAPAREMAQKQYALASPDNRPV